MTISFQPVTLDSDGPDRDAMLVYRDDRLLAVLTRLSNIHAGVVGQWFLEASFGVLPPGRAPVFETIDRFREWLAEPV